jgi:hypothetical protein
MVNDFMGAVGAAAPTAPTNRGECMPRTYFLFRFLVVIIAGTLALSACNLPASTLTAQPGLDQIGTAAAQTVVAELTKDAKNQPASPTVPPVITATIQPTLPTLTPKPTQAGNAPAPSPSSQAACDRAEFINDVTYPDGSNLAPGTAFVKTWRLKNTGTCTWGPNYALVFAGKDSMGGPSSTTFTNGEISPGEQVDISVNLKAPENPGSYEGDWLLRNAAGIDFGLGDNANEPFWVKINVVSGTRISMNTGATSVDVSGHVEKNGHTDYLANALAKQFMMIRINTTGKPLALEIQAPNGSTLVKASEKKDFWQGTLPADGDYLISIVNSGGSTDFDFSLTIPVRVSFKPGATSASMDGVVRTHETNTYLLQARKGQTMTVKIDSSGDDIYLAISGLKDGEPYLQSDDGETTYTFKLPADQDYVIQCVSMADAKEKYTITFTVK